MWDAYIGQPELKAILQTAINGSQAIGEPVPHILFAGPPGSGKTTLARIVATQAGVPLYPTSVTSRFKLDTFMLRIALQWTGVGVIFFDELHAMSKHDQEALNTLMSVGEYYTADGEAFSFANVTVLGATTKKHLIDIAVLDKFRIPTFAPYTPEDLAIIFNDMCEQAGFTFVGLGTQLVPLASGSPRTMIRLAQRAMELAVTNQKVNVESIAAYSQLGEDGMPALAIEILRTVAGLGGTASLSRLSNALGLPANDPDLLAAEMWLQRAGLLTIARSVGRRLTTAGVARCRML